MTGLSVLLLGIGLGLRHATDADHLVVVSALVQREPGVRRAARIAALWGAGHTVAFLALGLLVVLAEVRIPAAFEQGAELLVALMLIGFGLWHLVRSRGKGASETMPSVARASARPLVIGPMILSDRDLRRRLSDGPVVVDPRARSRKVFQGLASSATSRSIRTRRMATTASSVRVRC